MKKVYRYIKDNWIWYFLGFVIIGVISLPVQKYVDSHYTKDIDCTVVSAETVVRSTGSAGKPSSSATSIIETEECGELRFYSPVVDGLGMREATDRLVPGERYRFVVNRFDFMHRYPNVQDIKAVDGSPVDFASR